MKTTKTTALILAFFIAILSGCKREALTHEPVIQQPGISEKVKTWFEALPTANQTGTTKSIAQSDRKISKPEWEKTSYYPTAHLYITPVKFEKEQTVSGTPLYKYLVADANPEGEITSAKYMYILAKSDAPVPASLIRQPTPDFLRLQQVPDNFTGALFEYDLWNTCVSGKYFEKGKATTHTTRLSYKTAASGPGTNYVNPEGCENGGTMVCTEWYWQTWVNGELVYEEYLFTTCECQGGGGGGGGGGTGTINCQNITRAQAQMIMNSIAGTQININGGTSGPVIVNEETGEEVRNKYPVNEFYCIQSFLGQTLRYSAYFRGAAYRSGPTDFWKWSNLALEKVARSAGGLPPCITETISYQDLGVEYSPDKKLATAKISFNLTFKYSCIWGFEVKDIFLNSVSNYFHADK